MSDMTQEFKALEQKQEQNKTEKVRLEERLKGESENRAKLLLELTELGAKEEELATLILELEKTSQETLEEYRGQLNA